MSSNSLLIEQVRGIEQALRSHDDYRNHYEHLLNLPIVIQLKQEIEGLKALLVEQSNQGNGPCGKGCRCSSSSVDDVSFGGFSKFIDVTERSSVKSKDDVSIEPSIPDVEIKVEKIQEPKEPKEPKEIILADDDENDQDDVEVKIEILEICDNASDIEGFSEPLEKLRFSDRSGIEKPKSTDDEEISNKVDISATGGFAEPLEKLRFSDRSGVAKPKSSIDIARRAISTDDENEKVEVDEAEEEEEVEEVEEEEVEKPSIML